ncbi:MAG: 4Fe-4S binding protein [Gammaproteobacteria bacterium]|nr:4Fe-4S binding protein [Gammaproteobacteria bacterium]
MNTFRDYRSWFQSGFFLLFVLAPPLDIFRFDLTQNHFIIFGAPWTLGIDAFIRGEIGPLEAGLNLLLRGFLPLLLVGGGLIWTAWRYGRLYCGWLCPHFSVVETINRLMQRAGGKPSIWEPEPLPERQPDGRLQKPDPRYWVVVVPAALAFAFLWALSLLTYLLPPFEIYNNLLEGTLTPNQFRFLIVGTLLLFIEFMFARHLFCRFGCAVGLFQSLAWMANPRAMVVAFETPRAKVCQDCSNACDNVCPMRLKPRTLKRSMFTCTQCGQCLSACDQVQQDSPAGGLLHWLEGDCALPVVSGRKQQPDCFEPDTRESSRSLEKGN